MFIFCLFYVEPWCMWCLCCKVLSGAVQMKYFYINVKYIVFAKIELTLYQKGSNPHILFHLFHHHVHRKLFFCVRNQTQLNQSELNVFLFLIKQKFNFVWWKNRKPSFHFLLLQECETNSHSLDQRGPAWTTMERSWRAENRAAGSDPVCLRISATLGPVFTNWNRVSTREDGSCRRISSSS